MKLVCQVLEYDICYCWILIGYNQFPRWLISKGKNEPKLWFGILDCIFPLLLKSKMVKFEKNRTILDRPWDQMVEAVVQKYPNPHNKCKFLYQNDS